MSFKHFLVATLKKQAGEVNFNNIFYVIQYIKILSVTLLCNIYI